MLVSDVASSSVPAGAGCAVPAGGAVTHETQDDEDETDDEEDPKKMSAWFLRWSVSAMEGELKHTAESRQTHQRRS